MDLNLATKEVIPDLFWTRSIRTLLSGPLKRNEWKLSSFGWSPIFGMWEPGYQFIMPQLVASNEIVNDFGAKVC